MKKLPLLLFYFLTMNYVQSQPTLLSNEIPPFGTVMNYKLILFDLNIDTTLQGAGVTWNFSNLVGDSGLSEVVLAVLNPSNTPYGLSFPSSNYCVAQANLPDTSYTYFEHSTSKLERWGTYYHSIETYIDPKAEMVYPLSLNVSNFDTSIYSSYSQGGYYYMECIGSGTLMLHNSTHNALMVRVYNYKNNYPQLEYHWYDSDNGMDLLTFYASDPYVGAYYAIFLSTVSIGIEENDYIGNINFNNPVDELLHINLLSKINSRFYFTLTDILGKKLYETDKYLHTGTNEKLEIEFSNFKNGIYFLTINPRGSFDSTRTYKIFKR